VGGALRDAWRGLKSGMDDMKSGMDGELQIARFAELQDELELLGIPQELVGQLDEAQVRAAMRASVKLKDSQAVAMGGDGMYELTAAYEKVKKRL